MIVENEDFLILTIAFTAPHPCLCPAHHQSVYHKLLVLQQLIWAGLLELMERFRVEGLTQTTSMVMKTKFLESKSKGGTNFGHYLKLTKCRKNILFRKGFN